MDDNQSQAIREMVSTVPVSEDPSNLGCSRQISDLFHPFPSSRLSLSFSKDSMESAERELGLVFEGWDTNWWLRARAKGEIE